MIKNRGIKTKTVRSAGLALVVYPYMDPEEWPCLECALSMARVASIHVTYSCHWPEFVHTWLDPPQKNLGVCLRGGQAGWRRGDAHLGDESADGSGTVAGSVLDIVKVFLILGAQHFSNLLEGGSRWKERGRSAGQENSMTCCPLFPYLVISKVANRPWNAYSA